MTLDELGMLDEKEPCPIFTEYCQLWLADYIEPTRRATTHQRYMGLLKHHIGPVIGKMPIDEIKRADVRRVLLGIYKKGLSKSSVSQARNVISGVFEYAIDEELINFNPTFGILKKLGMDERKERKPVQPMSTDEVALLLNTCRQYWPKWYPLLLCAFRTGMRMGWKSGLALGGCRLER